MRDYYTNSIIYHNGMVESRSTHYTSLTIEHCEPIKEIKLDNETRTLEFFQYHEIECIYLGRHTYSCDTSFTNVKKIIIAKDSELNISIRCGKDTIIENMTEDKKHFIHLTQ